MNRRIFISSLSLLGCAASSDDDRGGPSSVPIDGIGRESVYIVNGADASITVLDPTTDSVVGEIILEGVEYPHHAYLDAAGERLYVAIPGVDLSGGHGGGHGGAHEGGMVEPTPAMVLSLDADTGALLASRELDAPNHNAIPAPGTGEVWTAESGQPGAVVVLDADNLDVLARIPVGDDPAEITFSPDGNYAFVCNTSSGTVSIVDVATKSVTSELTVGMTPVGAWPGGDGNMYVDNEGSGTLSVISPTSLEVVRTIGLGFTPAFAAVTAGGDLWVTDSEAGEVAVFDAVDPDAGPIMTIATGAGAHAIGLSADGGKAFVTNQSANSVSIVDIATGTVTATVTVGSKPNGLAVRGPAT